MSRIRKYDPETVKETRDKRLIEVDGDFLEPKGGKQVLR
jgi:hypothetical protein